jgi:TP901 family phage tail tape measure protein
MSSRTVSVILRAQIDNYRDNMRRAEQHTRDVERAAMSATQRFREHNEALTSMGKGAAIAGAAAAAGVALVVKASAEYGSKMAELRSLSGATTSQMKDLSAAAMEQGKAFGQSATQVADAEIELTKAGRSTAQIMGGDLKGALALAAAGTLDVAKATQIGVVAVTQFEKSGATIPHVADLLAAGSAKALGSVEDLGMALNQSGLVAAQMGLSVDETVGTLSAFAQAGLLGSDAGTSFKTMLLSLQSPSKQAAALLEQYNVHAYDAEGHFVGISKLAGQLKAGLGTASDAERDFALSTIFGTDAIRAANVLFKEGSTGISDWTKKVNVTGYAAQQAAGKMDSLQGDLTKLSSAFETALISAGTNADGGFRSIVQGATNVVGAISAIPGPIQGVAVSATALAGGAAILGGAFLLAVPKIAALRAELGKLGISGRGALGVFGKGAGLAAGIMAVSSALASAGSRGIAGSADMANALNSMKTGLRDVDKEFQGDWMNKTSGFRDALSQSFGNGGVNASSFAHGLSGPLKAISGGLIDLSTGFEKNERLLNAYGQQLSALADQDLPAAQSGFRSFVKEAGGGKQALEELNGAMPDYREKIVGLLTELGIAATQQNIWNAEQGKGAVGARVLAAAQEKAKQSAEHQAEGIAGLSGTAVAAKGDIDDLANAIEGFGSTTLDARAAQAAMQEAIEKATTEVGKNGKGINLHTKAGRENDAMLRDLASSTAAAAGKTLKMTGDSKAAENQMKEGRAAFIKAAAAAGIVGDKAERLADKYGLIPKNVSTAIGVTGVDPAVHKIGTVLAKLQGLDGKSARVAVHYEADGSAFRVRLGTGALPVIEKATGGAIYGPGTKGKDSVPAMLAPGEHVLTDRDVDRMGGQASVYAFRSALAAGALPGFAAGGSVTARLPSRSITLDRPKGFGGIFDQTRKAAAAFNDMNRELADYGRERDALRTANRREARAQKAYDAIDGSKKNRGAKRAAKASLDAAKKRVASLEKTHEQTKQDYQDAKDARAQANAAAASIRLGREDFQSAERRDPTRRSSDPLAYVDQLRQMSRDADFSPTRRKAMDKAANDSEKALVGLVKSSEKAKEKLDGLKDASEQLRTSVRDSIFGGYRAADSFSKETTQKTGSWVTRNGMRFQTTENVESKPTASGLVGYYAKGAAAAKKFADGLAKLAKGSLSPTLLAEVAGYGVEQGQPIVDALLSATSSQIAAINRDYRGIYASAGAAGTSVADNKYETQIAKAKENADAIQASITTEGEKLRKLIARAFGLTGYATGTSSAAGGIRWVGEQGPELVGFKGGERVLSAPDSARWSRGSSGGGSAGAAPVVVQAPPFPSEIIVRDMQGLEFKMRTVAREVVHGRNDEIAVRLIGSV